MSQPSKKLCRYTSRNIEMIVCAGHISIYTNIQEGISTYSEDALYLIESDIKIFYNVTQNVYFKEMLFLTFF